MEGRCSVCNRPWWAPENSFRHKNGWLKNEPGHPDTEGHYVFWEKSGEGIEHLIRWDNIAGDPGFRGTGEAKTLSTAVLGALSYDSATGKFSFGHPVG